MASSEKLYQSSGSPPSGGASFITEHVVHVQDPEILAVITPGINTLALSHPLWFDNTSQQWRNNLKLHIYEVIILIEYQYLG
jgi:hypothetical protein